MVWRTSPFKDPAINTHGNLKSGNVLVNLDRCEVKLTDYGQGSLKDLARTMTSIGTVAWTGKFLFFFFFLFFFPFFSFLIMTKGMGVNPTPFLLFYYCCVLTLSCSP
jgi:serine/threonine protein kinase